MAAPMPRNIATAVAQGDLSTVEALLSQGVTLETRSTDGMTPLGLAAFWGYADITQVLLKYGADISEQNRGTLWTALHCAAFQGHGPVIMKLMEHNPDLHTKDMRGRTPVDFASAHDSIWPFFAAAGCKRTPQADLISMDIVHKRSNVDDVRVGEGDYVMLQTETDFRTHSRDPNMEVAAITGDVLADGGEPGYNQHTPAGGLNVYRN